MVYVPLPDDDEFDTTYRSQGVHQNRDTTAKMDVDPMDRNGVTNSEKQAIMDAAAAATADNMAPQTIMPNERPRPRPDVATEVAQDVASASAANVSRVKAGSFKIGPTPGAGTQASYGDGSGSGMEEGEMADMAMAGAEGYMSGGSSGMMSGMGGMMSAQIGQDIASKDDEIDQATEALFQDDTVADAMESYQHRVQGRRA